MDEKVQLIIDAVASQDTGRGVPMRRIAQVIKIPTGRAERWVQKAISARAVEEVYYGNHVVIRLPVSRRPELLAVRDVVKEHGGKPFPTSDVLGARWGISKGEAARRVRRAILAGLIGRETVAGQIVFNVPGTGAVTAPRPGTGYATRLPRSGVALWQDGDTVPDYRPHNIATNDGGPWPEAWGQFRAWT